MNVFILTQEDALYIPRLIGKFLDNLPTRAHVCGAAILKGEIAIKNAVFYFKFMGLSAFSRQLTIYGAYRLQDLSDRIVPRSKDFSVASAMRKRKVSLYTPDDINSNDFLDQLRSMDVSLIVSVACPQIVRSDLLQLPENGCINIHGALLPLYRGRMPSFWVLANGETKTGVTVHYMNEKVDDGPIIVQKEVPIEPDDTLHSLILRSKVGCGANALVEAVKKILSGNVDVMPNDAALGSYFSKPTPEAVFEFRRRGRRFR